MPGIAVATAPGSVGAILGGSLGGITKDIKYKGVQLTLPARSWMVMFNATYSNSTNNPLNIWWDICTSSTTEIQFCLPQLHLLLIAQKN